MAQCNCIRMVALLKAVGAIYSKYFIPLGALVKSSRHGAQIDKDRPAPSRRAFPSADAGR